MNTEAFSPSHQFASKQPDATYLAMTAPRQLLQHVTLVILVALAGCATKPLAPDDEDRAAKLFRPEPDKGVIYIFRENDYYVTAHPVVVDGRKLGSMHSGTYFRLEVEQGEHDIWADGADIAILNKKFRLPLDVEKGELYFIQQTASSARSPHLESIAPDAGMSEVRKCRLMTIKALDNSLYQQ